MSKSASTGDESASELIDRRIAELGGLAGGARQEAKPTLRRRCAAAPALPDPIVSFNLRGAG